MRFLPYSTLVNEEALEIVLQGARDNISELDGHNDMTKEKEAVSRIEADIIRSTEFRCPSCGGAGMGNDGDSWDLSDCCNRCGGLGVKPPEEKGGYFTVIGVVPTAHVGGRVTFSTFQAADTAEEAAEFVRSFHASNGRTAIIVAVFDGFIAPAYTSPALPSE